MYAGSWIRCAYGWRGERFTWNNEARRARASSNAGAGRLGTGLAPLPLHKPKGAGEALAALAGYAGERMDCTNQRDYENLSAEPPY